MSKGSKVVPIRIEAHGSGAGKPSSGKHVAARTVRFTKTDPRVVSVGEDGTLRVFAYPSFKEVAQVRPGARSERLLTLSLRHDGAVAAVGTSAGRVLLVDLDGGEKLGVLDGERGGVFSPAGDHLATIGTTSEEVTLWRWGGEGELTSLRRFPPLARRHTAVQFAPTGSLLFVGCDGPIHRLTLPDGASEGVQRGHQIAVSAMRASPSGAILASTGADGTLFFWTIVGGDEVSHAVLERKSAPPEAAGASIPTEQELPLAFHPNGRSLAVALENEIQLRAVPDGSVKQTIEVPDGDRILGLDVAPDGARLVAAAESGCLYAFEL